MRQRFLFVGTILIVQIGWLSFPATRSQTPSVPAPPPKDRPLQLLGASSCASAACHNGSDLSRIQGREYALCLTDKHSQAYAALREDRSKKIEQRYRGLADWQSAQPERDVLCLKCHVATDIDRASFKEVNGVRQFRLDEGVSCESCHGPAERWLEPHRQSSWQTLAAAEKQARYGMTDTRGILSRAQGCAACHVGVPGMEVDHDLIAAGHPRLAFEFSSYHSLMTRHWDDAGDHNPARGGSPDFEAQVWMTGQIVVLKAALELLHHRAEGKSWPEFAEFDCYACHHDLRNPGAKQDRVFPGRVAGQLTWNRWSTAQAETALTLQHGKGSAAIEQGLQAIRQEMQKLDPNKETLRREIPKVVRLLEQALQTRAPIVPVRDAMVRVAKNPIQSWDDAAQTYIGLTAWERLRIDRRQPEFAGLRPNLETLRNLLLPDARYRLNEVGRTIEDIERSLQPEDDKK